MYVQHFKYEMLHRSPLSFSLQQGFLFFIALAKNLSHSSSLFSYPQPINFVGFTFRIYPQADHSLPLSSQKPQPKPMSFFLGLQYSLQTSLLPLLIPYFLHTCQSSLITVNQVTSFLSHLKIKAKILSIACKLLHHLALGVLSNQTSYQSSLCSLYSGQSPYNSKNIQYIFSHLFLQSFSIFIFEV